MYWGAWKINSQTEDHLEFGCCEQCVDHGHPCSLFYSWRNILTPRVLSLLGSGRCGRALIDHTWQEGTVNVKHIIYQVSFSKLSPAPLTTSHIVIYLYHSFGC